MTRPRGRPPKYQNEEERKEARRAQTRVHLKAYRARKKSGSINTTQYETAKSPTLGSTASPTTDSPISPLGDGPSMTVKQESLSPGTSCACNEQSFSCACRTGGESPTSSCIAGCSCSPPTSNLDLIRLEIDITGTLEERQLFFYFRQLAVDQLAHFWHDVPFWGRAILQASVNEPCVRHAVIAFASLHQDFALRSRNKSILPWDPFALSQFNKAIKAVREGNSSTSSSRLEVILITCVLFVCLFCMVGEDDQAIAHVEHGVRLLKTYCAGLLESNNDVQDGAGGYMTAQALQNTFRRLDLQATTWSMHHRPQLTDDIDSILVPDTFADLEEARNYLNRIIMKLLHTKGAGGAAANVSVDHMPIMTISKLLQVLQILNTWELGFAKLINSHTITNINEISGIRLSQMQAASARILATPEGIGIYQDTAMAGQYQTILRSAEDLVEIDKSKSRQFPLDRCLIAPLHLVVRRSMDLAFRAKALALLKDASRDKSAFGEMRVIVDGDAPP